MKSLRIVAPGSYRLLDLDVPETRQDELLLAPIAVGLCATDLELLDGSMVYLRNGQSTLPLTPGHEWVATVVGLGSGVTGFAVGDRVVGECSIGCGACAVCRAGAYHRCRDRRETGVMKLNGALAELMAFPARAAHVVPEGVSSLDAALVEPLAVAFRTVQRSSPASGSTVLVVGAGAIGMLCCQVLATRSGLTVHVLDTNRRRIAQAEQLGAFECPTGELYSHVIEASGTVSGLTVAYERLAPGGRLVIVGLTGEQAVPLPVDQIVVQDQELMGSLGSPGIWPEVLELLATRSLMPSELITDQFPLSDIEVAIELANRKLPSTGKIVVHPNEAPHV
jgi:threonine dehydrogenase-like Zn-dependent dehydrogenase